MKKNDIITIGEKTYNLYWDTALDGKTWCRVKVTDNRGRKYQYPHYFRTKKAARIHILATENQEAKERNERFMEKYRAQYPELRAGKSVW